MNQTLDQSAFNLIDEPWIPCTNKDGSPVELGLREIFRQNSNLHGIHGETSLVVASIYRLLLAILYHAMGIPSTRVWGRLWNVGEWDDKLFNAYWDKWYDRFYLFHPERPFYQWHSEKMREKVVIDLLPELASGNAATLFDHHTYGSRAYFSPGQAARSLIVVQAGSLAGSSGLAPRESSDAPWARGIIFLTEGNTLFETLMLNYMGVINPSLESSQDDRPFWEAVNPYLPHRSKPLGYLDYLTWPTRKIWLVPKYQGSNIIVEEVRMTSGLAIKEFLDPFYHYRIDHKRGPLMQRFNEDRVLWRDFDSFLRLHDPDQFRPPLTFFWLANLVADGILDRKSTYRYLTLGMANSQAKVDFYRENHFPLPVAYLDNERLVEDISIALQATENVRQKLGGALARLAGLLLSPTADDEGGRKPDRKDVQNLMGHWAVERYFWSELELPFFQLMQRLPKQGDTALADWDEILRKTARRAFNKAESLVGNDVKALRASVRARGQLEGGLKKLFDQP